jgi:hypothetical protein
LRSLNVALPLMPSPLIVALAFAVSVWAKLTTPAIAIAAAVMTTV